MVHILGVPSGEAVAQDMQTDGEIVLISCSTGKGGPCARNLATTIAENIPQVRVHAPIVNTNGKTFVFEDGIFKDVIFKSDENIFGDAGMTVGPKAGSDVVEGMTQEDLTKRVAAKIPADSLDSRVETFFENPVKLGDARGLDGKISPLYDRVGKKNSDEVFQLSLEQSLGPNIYGGKAVAYIQDDGSISIAFLTETGKTHHQQALGTLIGGEKGKLVYDGKFNDARIADLPNRAFGFEFQFDKKTHKIVGINHKSQITTIQIGKGVGGWKLKQDTLTIVEQELLNRIDPELFDNSFFEKPVDKWVNEKELPIAP